MAAAPAEGVRALRYFIVLALLGSTLQLSLLFHSASPLPLWLKLQERAEFINFSTFHNSSSSNNNNNEGDSGRSATTRGGGSLYISNDKDVLSTRRLVLPRELEQEQITTKELHELLGSSSSSELNLQPHEIELLQRTQHKQRHGLPTFGQSLTSRLAHFFASIDLFPRKEDQGVDGSTVDASTATPKRKGNQVSNANMHAGMNSANSNGAYTREKRTKEKHSLPSIQVLVTNDGKVYSNWQLR